MDYNEVLNSNRNWTEDFPHENGKYVNHCINCHKEFLGHKRRVICKPCRIKMETLEQIHEALHVVRSINKTIEETNESGQICYLTLRTDGSVFEIQYLSDFIFSSEHDFVHDVKTCDNSHSDGLSEYGKKLEQFIWDRMTKIVTNLEKESKFIYSYSSNGRGL